LVVANEDGLESHHEETSTSNPQKKASNESLQEALLRSPGGLSNRGTQTELEIKDEMQKSKRRKSMARINLLFFKTAALIRHFVCYFLFS